jgi:hypothetical protein
MRNLVVAFAAGVAISVVSLAAQAMPVGAPAPQTSSGDITLVAGGCGPGFHRGPYGGCRPNGGPVLVRRCVWRMTPMGRRRFCD